MRELHIKIPKPKFANVIGVIILVGLIVSGLIIIKNINKEFAIREIAGKFQEFKYATLSFNNIYSGLPGDIPNANFYWKDVTRDGNGDRMISHDAGEGIAAWQQLQLSKTLELPYELTGKWSGSEGMLKPEINVPSIRDSNTGFFINYSEALVGNVFGLGEASDKPGTFNNPALTPNEAYMLDLMLDDGYPDKGILIAISHDNSGDCHAVGEYKKEKERKECLLLFKL